MLKNVLAGIICGVEHSGTTIALDILKKHPKIGAQGECGFLLNDSPDRYLNSKKLYIEHFKRDYRVTDDELKEIINTKDFAAAYRRTLDAHFKIIGLTDAKQKETIKFIDKTPAYIYDLTRILKMTGNIPVIVMQKDPKNLAYSYKHRHQPLDEMLRRFTTAYLDNLPKALDFAPDRILIIRFEDLVQNPQKVVPTMLSHFNLDMDPAYTPEYFAKLIKPDADKSWIGKLTSPEIKTLEKNIPRKYFITQDQNPCPADMDKKSRAKIAFAVNLFPSADPSSQTRQKACIDSILALKAKGLCPVNICFNDEKIDLNGWHILPALSMSADKALKIPGKRKPFVDEIFNKTAEWASQNHLAWFAYANNDILITGKLISTVHRLIDAGYDTIAVSRNEVSRFDSNGAPIPGELEFRGFDVFFCKTAWWLTNRSRFGAYILGERAWDDAYVSIMLGNSKCKVLYQDGLCLHLKHAMHSTNGAYSDWNMQIYRGRDRDYANRFQAFVNALEPSGPQSLSEEGLNQLIQKLFDPDFQPEYVNIGMVTYNRLEFTRQSIQSVISKTAFPFVLTVVDNNSTDGTVEYLKALKEKGIIKNLVLLNKNVGIAKASNLAWHLEPRAGFYLKLDNDIVIQKHNWLKNMVDVLIHVPEIGIIGYNFEPKSHPRVMVKGYKLRQKNTLGGACVLIPKSTEKRLGYWCEAYGPYGEEDADYSYRNRLSGFQSFYMEDENIGLHLPAGKAAHIDKNSYAAADGKEEIEQKQYRQWKDQCRRNNVHGGRYPQNKNAYKTGQKPLFIESDFAKAWLRDQSKRAASTPGSVTVSIIIPVFNKIEYTSKCLQSIVKNTHGIDYEVIIVDNNSTDGTKAFLKQLDGDVTIITNPENKGFAKSNNQAADKAKGNFLVFLNNDTEVQKNWLPPLLETIQANPDAGAVGAKLLFPDGTLQHAGVIIIEQKNKKTILPRHVFIKENPEKLPVNYPMVFQAVTAACLMIKKADFHKAGGFDEGYWNGCEDVDLCFKLRQMEKKIVYQPESVVIHHESKSGYQRKVAIQKNNARLREKWTGIIAPDIVEDGSDVHQGNAGIINAVNNNGEITRRFFEQALRWWQAFSSGRPFQIIRNNTTPGASVQNTASQQKQIQNIGCRTFADRANYLPCSTTLKQQPAVPVGNAAPLHQNTSIQGIVAQKQLNIAIKTCTPSRSGYLWGDTWYARSLANALNKTGNTCAVHFKDEWDRPDHSVDITIHIKGKFTYTPKPHCFNILWIISHPELHTPEEINRYDLVFCASLKYLKYIEAQINVPCLYLPQVTDDEIFTVNSATPQNKDIDLLFVGTNYQQKRGRRIIRDILSSGRDYNLSVIGRHWKEVIDPKYIKADYIKNHDLPSLYRRAKIVLNDHHEEMRKFGFINNRTFDLAAVKAFQISDTVEGLNELGIVTYQTPVDLYEKLDYYLEHAGQRDTIADTVHDRCRGFTFSRAAKEICNAIKTHRHYSRAAAASDTNNQLHAWLAKKSWLGKVNLYSRFFESVYFQKNISSPAISIIVISWRLHPDTIKNFEVLSQQRDQNFELIFVNNGGAKGEFNALQPFIDTDIKLNKNTGAYVARNIGAVFAKAPILLFLEDDGIPAAGFVREHIKAHTSYDAIAVRGIYSPRTDNPINALAGHYNLGPDPFPWYSSLEGNSSYQADIFFRAGGWNDAIEFGHGGRELSIRLSQIEPDLRKQLYCPGPVIYHDYARNKKHYRDKIARQEHTLARLLQQYPQWHDYFKFWKQHKYRTDLVIRKEPVQTVATRQPGLDTSSETAAFKTGPSPAQATRIDFLACEHHNFSHLLPVWEKIPPDQRGAFYILTHLDPADQFKEKEKVSPLKIHQSVQALIQDLNQSRQLLVTSSFFDPFLQQVIRPMVFLAHGGGQTYQGQPLHLYTRKNYVLDIVPNNHMAEVFNKRYPASKKHIVGCPKLDKWHTSFQKKNNPKPVIALSFHFDRTALPETRTAWPHFKPALKELAAQKQWRILGHGHPRIINTLIPFYEKLGIEIVRDFDQVLQTADLYICDHMSTLYEFASTGRPVVVLNAPWYRRDIEHGLRFWEHADVGINCDRPENLIQAIEKALIDPPARKAKREKAVQGVYAHVDGKASERAARAIIDFTQNAENKNNLLLYPDTSENNIENFIHHCDICAEALDHHYKMYLAKLQQISGRIHQPSECGIPVKDVEYYFWTLALLLAKSGKINNAVNLCADFKKAFGPSEKLETLNRILSSGSVVDTTKDNRPQQHPEPGTPALSAVALCDTAYAALKKGDLQKAVTTLDYVLEKIDPLNYQALTAFKRLEEELGDQWKQSRENYFISRYSKDPCTWNALLASQFHQSPVIMKYLYDRVMRTQTAPGSVAGSIRVSMIMACYNGEAEIEKTVTSILNQSYQNWELIIVNDGSTDATGSALSEIKTKDSRIIVHNLDNNCGVSHARNTGFHLSKGQYIVFVDCGDEITPDYLTEMITAAKKHPDAGWIYPVSLQLGFINRIWSYRDFSVADNLTRACQPVTSLIQRGMFEKLGGFSEDFKYGYEDWNFWISAVKAGYCGKLLRKILFIYHKQESSRSDALHQNRDLECRVKKAIIKNHPLFYRPIGKTEEQLLKDQLRIDAQLLNKPYIKAFEKQTYTSANLETHQTAAGSGRNNKLAVQFYIYKNVHWPMFEQLYHYLINREEVGEIILCLPYLPQLIGAQNYTLIDKLFSLGATLTTSPYAKKADVTFIADAFAGKVQGCGKIVNIGHGTISKGYYFTDSVWTERENWVDLLCVPGTYALEQFSGKLKTKVAATGMPKMDPVFSGKYDRKHLCRLLDIDPVKKIILYAPTFNTDLSSVYHFQNRIAELAAPDRYILIKLHGTTLPNTVLTYRKQAEKHENVIFIDDPNIAPYIGGADIMISDVSSACMEFMALNKPVILYNNPDREKYHSYNPENIEYQWRDLGTEVNSFEELKYKLADIIKAGDDKSEIRKAYAARLFADLQGNAAENVWNETKRLFSGSTAVTAPPVFSDIIILSDDNQFAVRDVIYNLQFHASMSHELVLVDTSTSGETRSFTDPLKQFNQFINIQHIRLNQNRSRDACIIEGIKKASGSIILFLDDSVGIYKNFDYILYKTFKHNPGIPALTGLSNQDSENTHYKTYLPQDTPIPFDRLAFDLINTFSGTEVADSKLQTWPPLFALQKASLRPDHISAAASFPVDIRSDMKICLSLLYTTVPQKDMATLKHYWLNRKNIPIDQRIKIQKDILASYAYPDIAENLFNDLLTETPARQPAVSLATRSLHMRYYDLDYKKRVRNIFQKAFYNHDVLDQDIKIIERLIAEQKAPNSVNHNPSQFSRQSRVLFYFFKNVHIPVLVPIYKSLKQNYPDMDIAFGYMPYAPQIRAGFSDDELRILQSFGERMYADPRNFKPDLCFIADSVYPWVKGCGKLVHVGHGVLSKGQYYTHTETARREEQADLVCVPGPYHKTIMQQLISKPIAATGMAKLDPVFAKKITRETVLKKYGLPENFRYILFAPTFNDELSAVPFVRDRINEVIPDDRTAMIIKLHGSAKPEYKTLYQNLVQKDPRVIFADELDITPFLALCDVMISDVSSAMMEFAALDKPLVLFNNPNWESYQNYTPDDIEFKWRDIGIQVTSLEEMKQAVKKSLSCPSEYSKKRIFYSELLFANKGDGRASDRIITEALTLLKDAGQIRGAA